MRIALLTTNPLEELPFERRNLSRIAQWHLRIKAHLVPRFSQTVLDFQQCTAWFNPSAGKEGHACRQRPGQSRTLRNPRGGWTGPLGQPSAHRAIYKIEKNQDRQQREPEAQRLWLNDHC